MKEVALAERADEEIVVTIIVIVPHCSTQAEHRNCKPSFRAYVCKCAVMIVAVELEG